MALSKQQEPIADVIDYYKEHLQSGNKVNKRIFWLDLWVTAIFFWCFFILSFRTSSILVTGLLLFIASIFLYRGLAFSHEIVHHPAQLKWFRWVWDLLFGVVSFYPSYLYQSHLDHHKAEQYGTLNDPEYILLADKKKTLKFLAATVFLPIALIVRTLLFPISMVSRKFDQLFQNKLHHFTINLQYQPKPFNDTIKKKICLESSACSFILYGYLVLLMLGVVSFQIAIYWYVVVLLALILNQIRFLFCTHHYTNISSKTLSEQIADSVNYDSNSLLAIVIAPVGLRYHALHHLFPGIPYHSLKKIHHALQNNCKDSQVYQSTIKRQMLKNPSIQD